MVMPTTPLMEEHLVIKQMIKVINKELKRMDEEQTLNENFLEKVVEFIQLYSNKLHEGKEEEILFRELNKKDLEEDHQEMMQKLVVEHRWLREKVAALVNAKKDYFAGEKNILQSIIDLLTEIADFYPRHLEKEDNEFFIAAMEYFSPEEKTAMLAEQRKFDQNLIHDHYKEQIEKIDKSIS
ncbi:MAG: cation-binding protein [Candidatus Heimdallarchaeota archaeon]|nr:cation-binding protein [Candidatus Heimdallarchaeota archaeon]